jgi:hypothetical protein
MKRFLVASVLACVLSSTALAGLIPSTGIAPPQPPENTQTSPGIVPSSDATSPDMPTYASLLLTALGLVF